MILLLGEKFTDFLKFLFTSHFSCGILSVNFRKGSEEIFMEMNWICLHGYYLEAWAGLTDEEVGRLILLDSPVRRKILPYF